MENRWRRPPDRQSMLCHPKDTYKPKGRPPGRQRSLGISLLIQRPTPVPLLEEQDDFDVILAIQGLRDGRLTKIVASDCSVDQSAYDPAYLSRYKYDRGCKLGRLCPRRPCLQTGVPGGEFSDVSQCLSLRRARNRSRPVDRKNANRLVGRDRQLRERSRSHLD
jgi:hypothetical protein